MTTVTISLPDLLKEFVDKQLATKGYGNVSEYFRSLLREAQAKEEDARLEALLLEGLASKSIPLDDDFWKRLRGKDGENPRETCRAQEDAVRLSVQEAAERDILRQFEWYAERGLADVARRFRLASG